MNYAPGLLCPGGLDGAGYEDSADRLSLRASVCRIEILGCYAPDADRETGLAPSFLQDRFGGTTDQGPHRPYSISPAIQLVGQPLLGARILSCKSGNAATTHSALGIDRELNAFAPPVVTNRDWHPYPSRPLNLVGTLADDSLASCAYVSCVDVLFPVWSCIKCIKCIKIKNLSKCKVEKLDISCKFQVQEQNDTLHSAIVLRAHESETRPETHIFFEHEH